MTAPLISIVTPTRNRLDVLSRAVQSVLNQTTTNFEYLIVDDRSSDGTAESIQSLAEPRIKYVRLTNGQGGNAARNVGIERSRAPIVTFLDSDDVFLPNRLEHTLARFGSNPELSLMISSFLTNKDGRNRPSINRENFLPAPILERALICQTVFIAGSAITVRREALLAAGSFDPEIYRFQDRELLLRLSQKEGAFLSDEADWIKYASRDSISGQRNNYVRSYGDFVNRHSEIMKRYPVITPYMIARRTLMNILQGRLPQALRDFRENRSHPALGYTAADLLRGYPRGRGFRSNVRSALNLGKADTSHTPQPGPANE